MKLLLFTTMGMLLPAMASAAGKAQPVKALAATASSGSKNFPASLVIDGDTGEASCWKSGESASPSWLAIDLGKSQKIAGIHFFSGTRGGGLVESFKVEFWRDSQWNAIPSAEISNNREDALAIAFDQTVSVETDKIRILIPAGGKGKAIREVVVWPAGQGDLPPLPKGARDAAAKDSKPQGKIPEIYLNQSGFNLGKPKRFTAPTLADGTPFIVRPTNGGPSLVNGVIRNQAGDFSSFNPEGSGEYVVEAGGITSVSFRVGRWWLERVSYQNSVNFMIDSRHRVGNDRAVCGGSFGWRDDHHFGWELRTLVPQFLSNPSAYERMPRQVKYEKPGDKKFWGALEPYREDAPDIVKLIHWGADVIVTQKLGHEMMKAELAYFLYAWPVLQPWLPEQNYLAVLDYAFSTWPVAECDRRYPYDESPEHNLLALKTKLGSTKGCLPPGFSLEPNLLMHEVARREKRGDSEVYFDAAFKQADWMVKNLDWNDPMVTKGQRMSEFITMTGLAHFSREYPGRAPEGLADKIREWTDVIIRRSDNLWDFRKLDDSDGWCPVGDTPQKWNEPGNVIGLPAAILAAREFITNTRVRGRLDEITWAHFDNMFGRNPVGRHFSYDAPREIEGVENGWFKFHVGGIGRLADARFVIDGSPKNGHYPYHPEAGDIGWTEGWIQFNTAYDVSLAYLAWSDSRIELEAENGDLVIRLTAPVNFDYSKAETAVVNITSAAGDAEKVVVTENSLDSATLTGRVRLVPGKSAMPGDGAIQYPPGSAIEADYGYGYLGTRATFQP